MAPREANARRWAGAAALHFVAALALAACVTNPATGRRQLDLLSREREIALGEQAKGALAAQYGGALEPAQLQAYVSRVGASVAAKVEAPYRDLPWEFTLLDDDNINAFALPGGKVFITRGLASRLTNEAQLAAVLGHEVGHVTAEHADKRISSELIVQGIILGASAAAGGADDATVREAVPLVVSLTGQGFLLKFSRDEELEADRLGMRYMTAAGYDPRGMLQLMQILEGEAAGAPRGLELFSTHPHPGTRIAAIEDRLGSGPYREAAASGTLTLEEWRYRTEFLAALPAP